VNSIGLYFDKTGYWQSK